jgi:hypothetical protein
MLKIVQLFCRGVSSLKIFNLLMAMADDLERIKGIDSNM